MAVMAAVDLGAQSGRVAVGRFDGERLGVTEVHRFRNQHEIPLRVRMRAPITRIRPKLTGRHASKLLNAIANVHDAWSVISSRWSVGKNATSRVVHDPGAPPQ